ncbi:MAG TPA: DoxX family protein [Terriglobales bacterium]|nr:DoxX family protein [Terriglobales bacterium]
MNSIEGIARSLLRLVAGGLFLCHGAMKLFGWFGGMPPGATLTPLLHVAGWIEFVGGALILLGLFTRAAAFFTAGEMAVAYFKAHFPHGFWPIVNKGELAVLFCFVFLFLLAGGAGPISLDRAIARARGAARRQLVAG